MSQSISTGGLVWIEAGHNIPIEAPADLVETIRAFDKRRPDPLRHARPTTTGTAQ